MGDSVVLVGVVAVVGGEEGCIYRTGDLNQLRVGPMLFRYPLILELHEQVVATEDLLQATCLCESLVVVVAQQRLKHVPSQTTCGGDEPLTVIREDLPVHAGLVVIALHECTARHLNEVLVAGVVLSQEGEVVHELAPTLGLTTGVVHPASS